MAESTYTDEFLQTLTRRLEQLELQAAALGLQTPPHVSVEIEDIKAKIEQVKVENQSIISIEIIERMTPAEQWKRLYDEIWKIEKIVYTLQQNDTNNRIHQQKRHAEFNTAIQNIIFEHVLIKRDIHRLNVLVLIIGVLSLLFAFIWVAIH